MQLQRAFKVIKSIQRGEVANAASSGGVSVIVAPVDMSKAFMAVSSKLTSVPTSYGGMAGCSAVGKLVSSTEVLVSSAGAANVYWELVEYV